MRANPLPMRPRNMCPAPGTMLRSAAASFRHPGCTRAPCPGPGHDPREAIAAPAPLVQLDEARRAEGPPALGAVRHGLGLRVIAALHRSLPPFACARRIPRTAVSAPFRALRTAALLSRDSPAAADPRPEQGRVGRAGNEETRRENPRGEHEAQAEPAIDPGRHAGRACLPAVCTAGRRPPARASRYTASITRAANPGGARSRRCLKSLQQGARRIDPAAQRVQVPDVRLDPPRRAVTRAPSTNRSTSGSTCAHLMHAPLPGSPGSRSIFRALYRRVSTVFTGSVEDRGDLLIGQLLVVEKDDDAAVLLVQTVQRASGPPRAAPSSRIPSSRSTLPSPRRSASSIAAALRSGLPVPAQPVGAEIPGDPVQPGGELRLSLEAIQAPIHPEEHLLRDVLRVLAAADEAQRHAVHRVLVAAHELAEHSGLAASHAADDLLIGHLLDCYLHGGGKPAVNHLPTIPGAYRGVKSFDSRQVRNTSEAEMRSEPERARAAGRPCHPAQGCVIRAPGLEAVDSAGLFYQSTPQKPEPHLPRSQPQSPVWQLGHGARGPFHVRGEQAQLLHDPLAVAGGAGDPSCRTARGARRSSGIPCTRTRRSAWLYSRSPSRSPRQITRMRLYRPSPSLTVSMSP